MKTFDMPQYSKSWWEVRRGVPTCSNFGRIITPKTGKLAAAHEEYICELLGDVANPGDLAPAGFVSPAMLQGSLLEPEARHFYCMERGVDVHEIGFCLDDRGRFGGSPDGLIGADGCLELKCPQFKTQIRYLLDGGLPDEYRAQVHGHLIVTGRKYCDFLSYCVGLEPLLVRVESDDFTVKLMECLGQFWNNYAAAWEKIFPGREIKLAA